MTVFSYCSLPRLNQFSTHVRIRWHSPFRPATGSCPSSGAFQIQIQIQIQAQAQTPAQIQTQSDEPNAPEVCFLTSAASKVLDMVACCCCVLELASVSVVVDARSLDRKKAARARASKSAEKARSGRVYLCRRVDLEDGCRGGMRGPKAGVQLAGEPFPAHACDHRPAVACPVAGSPAQAQAGPRSPHAPITSRAIVIVSVYGQHIAAGQEKA